jgi:hypothetical protein
VEGNGDLVGNAVLRNRLVGTKSAKASQKAEKEREGAAYWQAQATTLLAEATVATNVLLAEQNLLILMTTPDSQIGGGAAQRFIRMWQEEELQKYEARKEEDRLKLQKEADEQEVARIEVARLEGEQSAREEAEFVETVRQVDERAAAMAAEGDGSEFGENIHYPSSPEEFGQPPDDAANWDDEIGLGTSSDFIEETEELNLWGLSGGRIYGSAAGGLYGGAAGRRGGPAGRRRGPIGGRAASSRVGNSQLTVPETSLGHRGRGGRTGRRGAGQAGGRTEAAGGACRHRRGAGRREEATRRREESAGRWKEPTGRREEPVGLGGSAYIGGGHFACVGGGLNAFAVGEDFGVGGGFAGFMQPRHDDDGSLRAFLQHGISSSDGHDMRTRPFQFRGNVGMGLDGGDVGPGLVRGGFVLYNYASFPETDFGKSVDWGNITRVDVSMPASLH